MAENKNDIKRERKECEQSFTDRIYSAAAYLDPNHHTNTTVGGLKLYFIQTNSFFVDSLSKGL